MIVTLRQQLDEPLLDRRAQRGSTGDHHEQPG